MIEIDLTPCCRTTILTQWTTRGTCMREQHNPFPCLFLFKYW